MTRKRVARAADVPVHDVLDAQLAARAQGVRVAAEEAHDAARGPHDEAADVREARDDGVGEAEAEVVFAGLARAARVEELEGEHGDRGLRPLLRCARAPVTSGLPVRSTRDWKRGSLRSGSNRGSTPSQMTHASRTRTASSSSSSAFSLSPRWTWTMARK